MDLLSHYKQDTDGAYFIEIAISTLEDFFDQLDPAPHDERDVEPRICQRIMEQIIVFPPKASVKFLIHIPKRLKNKESVMRNALQHHFEHELLDSRLHLKRRLMKGRITFLAASMIFVTAMTLSSLLEQSDSMLLYIVAEGLYIGGWVSLWHPIQTLLYEWLPLSQHEKTYKRLLDSAICFTYSK
jgi:hypothetical protein